MFGGNIFDVPLVCTNTIMPPQHFLHHLDTSTSPTHDKCISSPKPKVCFILGYSFAQLFLPSE
jgi:hypothetical protein